MSSNPAFIALFLGGVDNYTSKHVFKCNFFFPFGYSNCMGLSITYFMALQYLGRALWMGGSVGGIVDDSWLGVWSGGSVRSYVGE